MTKYDAAEYEKMFTNDSIKFMEEVNKHLLEEIYEKVVQDHLKHEQQKEQQQFLESIVPKQKDNTPVFTIAGVRVKDLTNMKGFGIDINGDVKWIMK